MESFVKARQLLRADWDSEGTLSVHLPRPLAHQLAAQMGIRANPMGQWFLPDGTFVWELTEALQITMCALALDLEELG